MHKNGIKKYIFTQKDIYLSSKLVVHLKNQLLYYNNDSVLSKMLIF
jgi:hypothetical protein